MENRPIGIFDSGIGGLTVLQNMLKKYPNENYIYVGDNKHCPYGDKTKEQLYEYASAIIDYFIEEKVKLIVVACNTISSNILPLLVLKYPNVKIIGVVNATTNLMKKSNLRNVLVIATHATIESHTYKNEIESANPNIIVNELATPSLVPLIESGSSESLEKELLKIFNDVNTKFDGVVLGCTHYAIIENLIRKTIGNKTIINSSNGIVDDVDEYLTEHNIKGTKKRIQIFTTGVVKDFVFSSSNFFDYKNISVQKLF